MYMVRDALAVASAPRPLPARRVEIMYGPDSATGVRRNKYVFLNIECECLEHFQILEIPEKGEYAKPR
jgi:hypothetical protein